MHAYQKVFEVLGLPKPVIECAAGAISCPMEGWAAPPFWYGYPPALLPVWSQGSRPKYWGYWKHWFCDRKPTYVQMYIAADSLTLEIARNTEQFFAYSILSAIVEEDGVTPRIEEFSQEVGINYVEKIDELSCKTGDNPEELIALESFRKDPPLVCFSSLLRYYGDFPHELSYQDLEWTKFACEFEVDEEFLDNWPREKLIPSWLRSESSAKFLIFRNLLEEGNLNCAWLHLNSKGWNIKDAKKAIAELAAAAADKEFDLLASAWLSVADEKVGGY